MDVGMLTLFITVMMMFNVWFLAFHRCCKCR